MSDRVQASRALDGIYSKHPGLRLTLAQVRSEAVKTVLQNCSGNKKSAAQVLKIAPATLTGILVRSAFAVLLVLVVGCSTTKNEKQSHQVPLPPMPRTARSSAGTEVNNVAGAIAPPVKPRTIRLEWNKGDPHPETVTQVWQAPEVWSDPPEAMIAAGLGTMVGEFSEPRCELPATGARMFYIIRNRLGNELSDWARK